MATKKRLFTPWSSLDTMLGKPPTWWPEEERVRIQAYEKYDQMYWNDPTQYAIRILENEQPLYVPNARVIVDTTAQYLLKGLKITPKSGGANEVLDDFFKRERFFSKFHINKQAGIARGDWAFHVRATPEKEEGTRISIDTLHPGQVYKVYDEDDPDKVIRIHLVQLFEMEDKGEKKERINKLTYERNPDNPLDTRVFREQAIYEITPEWYGPEPKKVKQLIEYGPLPDAITQFPVYWFPNIEWESQDYGSSELRGLEFLEWAVSQGATDTQMALGLEGLGVYATDGGRPVDDDGTESDWEVAPGKVMEVPAGSYFRRVEGVGSVTPMMDQLKYLESKMYAATGLTDVALGQVDVQVAQSGIALAIKFMPTLAKIEHRDTSGLEILRQMMFDLQKWYEAYEPQRFPEVNVDIAASKLPPNRTETLNELNNMLDRKIISRKYYRSEAIKLGYQIPANMETEIQEEREADAKIAALAAPPGLQQNAEDAAAGKKPITNASGGNNDNVDKSGNSSNNRNRPNESSGTEATQPTRRQARGSR